MSSDRPLITFAIFAYNHERFIAEAVRGALSQTYSPLEIIISDDCSKDRTFEIIQSELAGYSGPHIVRPNRNETNLGFGGNINRVMSLAEGKLIVAASADDVSLPERVEKLYQAHAASGGRALSVFSNCILIDEDGTRLGRHLPSIRPESLKLINIAKRLGGALGATHAWDRQVFEVFGPIVEKKTVAEDSILSFRSALLGEVKFIDEALVLYRLHGDNAHFKGPNDVGPGELVEALREHSDMWIDICEQRLKDVETIMGLFPERSDDLSRIRRITLRHLREKRDHKALLLTASPLRRAIIMFRAVGGVRFRALIRWLLTFFFPSLYLAYQRSVKPSPDNAHRD